MRQNISLLDRLLNRFGYSNNKYHFTLKERLQGLLGNLIPLEIPLERIGGEEDGAYLIPKYLPLPTAVFSPGVNESDTFELHYAQLGVPCYLADFSVDQNPNPHENIHFIKKYIGYGSDAFIPMEEWIQVSVGKQTSGMLLQMDIEGWEYQNLINISSETLSRFECICIEFHGFNRLGYWKSFDLMKEVFDKILRDFVPVHVHANNCCGFDEVHGFLLPTAIEMTFVNRESDVVKNKTKRISNMDNPLDGPNDVNKKEISLNSWLTI